MMVSVMVAFFSSGNDWVSLCAVSIRQDRSSLSVVSFRRRKLILVPRKLENQFASVQGRLIRHRLGPGRGREGFCDYAAVQT